MHSEDKYFNDLTENELWQRYCGFLDLSIDEFMEIQEELLVDEIERVADSTLGKKIMNNRKPKSVEEFRRTVPLTTYEDYEPYLSQRQEDALTEKPYLWCHSSGRGGYFKWIPHTTGSLEKITRACIGSLILASARQKGDVNVSPGFRLLTILPPAPYVSGSLFQITAERLSYKTIPPPETSESMEFQERIRKGFQIALKEGVDFIGGLASILVKIGEEFTESGHGMKFSPYLLHPKIIFRLLRAWFRSKRERRTILPKDLWSIKGIPAGGVDTVIYRDDIAHYWGVRPLEIYACAEAFFLAMQSWNRKGMVFLPDMVFLEFIPQKEQLESRYNNGYQSSTVLLNELEEGQSYEVVITQFYGRPLLRYRLKDLIRVVALRDGETEVNLPQVVFQCRVGETINLGGLANLDERAIWQAIANTKIKCADWSACKEYEHNQSFLRLYLELKEKKEATEVEIMINEQLKLVDLDYRDIDSYLALQPVRVSLLSSGTFQRYMGQKVKEGADLAHLKPTHINPPDEVIQLLLQLSEVTKGNGESSV